MSKTEFLKPGNFIYPVPAVMVSCGSMEGEKNIITVAWTGTVCSDPPMAYISVRPERYSYHILKEGMEFVINLPDNDLANALDFCGCTSGEKIDKFSKCGLTPEKSSKVKAPSILEAPVSIECRCTQILELGTHHMFLAEVLAVRVDDRYLDEKGVFHMEEVGLLAYEHGRYRELGRTLGTFGYSVRRKQKK